LQLIAISVHPNVKPTIMRQPSRILLAVLGASLVLTGTAQAGGYVPPNGTLIQQATSIQVSGVNNVAVTFNNATLTDQNTIAETNNNPVKTPSTADPVSTVTGNNYHDETDIVIRGRGINYAFTRTYNSTPSATKVDLGFGFGWTHSYSMRLKSNDYGKCPNCTSAQAAENGNGKTSSVTYTDERGGDHNYLVNETTYAITPPDGEYDSLALDTPAAGQHTLTFRNGTKYVFQTVGAGSLKTTPNLGARLIQIADAYGNQLNFAYDGSGRLSTITDNLGIAGRTGLAFGYVGAATQIATVTDWTGRQWAYGYDAAFNLSSVTNPLSQKIQYGYVAGSHNLTTVTLPQSRNGIPVTTTFRYYQNGKTFNYANSLGHTETLDYDLYRKTTRVTDPRGGIREYEYDPSGRMTKLSEPDGAILMFGNGLDGVRYKKTDGLGYVTQYSYRSDKSFNTASDTFGNVTREQDALNQTVDTTYGPYDQPATVTDKRGTVTTTSYYSATGTCAVVGKPQSVTISAVSGTANVKLVDYCWNADVTLANQVDYIDPANPLRKRTTAYTYQAGTDGLNVQSMTVSGATSGGTITVGYTFDALGRKQTETLTRRKSAVDPTPVGLTTTYGYDALDRVTSVTDPLGNFVVTTYDGNGKVYQVIGNYKQTNGTFVTRILSTRSYDAADRLVTDTDVLGNTTTYTYDAAGNVASILDPENHTTSFEYDAMNRRTAIINGNGFRTQSDYDLAGHVVAVTNPNGEKVLNSFDAIGRLISVTDPKGYITQFKYDANGNRTCTIDANAQVGLQPKNSDGCSESRTYDELNRVTQVKDAQGYLTLTTYDLLGHVTKVTDATSKATSIAYDDLGRQISMTDPLLKTATATWDEAGNRLTLTNRLNQVTRTTYDNLNRPTLNEYLTDAASESIGYDPYGNKSSAANANVTYTFGYDTKNRLTSKLDSRAGKSLSFTYDKVGNILTKTDFQGHVTTYRYDSANHVASAKNPDFLEVSYQHDPAGRVLSRILSNGAISSYTYDADGFLATLVQKSADGTLMSSATYTRDRLGNTLTQIDLIGTTTYVYDPLYRLSSATYPGTNNAESFTYDAVGNRQVHTLNGTAHAYELYPGSNRIKAIHTGTLTGAIEKSFTFDDEGRLTAQTGTGATTITWDQKNRAASIAAGGRALTFQYDPMDYRIGSRGATAGNKDYYLEGEHLEAVYSGVNIQAKYFRGVSTDELVASWQFDPLGNWIPYVYHHDNVMSVTGVSAHTGTPLERTSFGAFGNALTDTGSTSNSLKYTGRESDPDTGLYYYRARYYDTTIGRFLSEDQKGFAAGINFYAYVGNNPVNFNDPFGFDKTCQCLGLAFSAVGPDQALKGALKGYSPPPNDSLAISPAVFGLPFPADLSVRTATQLEIIKNIPNIRISAPSLSEYLTGGTTFTISDIGNKDIRNSPIPRFDIYRFATTEDAIQFGKQIVPATITGLPDSWSCPASCTTLPSIPNAINSTFGPQSSIGESGAAGGFLIYPNKPNTNQLQSVYAK
jgi:RHS repeat-associated protein